MKKRIHLITNIDDLKTIDPTKKYVMTNQTTISLYDVYDLCEKAKEILPFVEIEKETCTATKYVKKLLKTLKMMLILSLLLVILIQTTQENLQVLLIIIIHVMFI